MRRKFNLWMAVVFLGTGCYAAEPQGLSYSTYQNDRFGYVVSYPTDVFVAKEEATNGDGRRLESKDGTAEVLVWGNYNALNQTLLEAFQEEVSAKGRKVTYKHLGRGFFIVSGVEGTRVFYEKRFIRKDTFYTLLLHYPLASKSTYDPIVIHIVKSFYINKGID